VLTRTYGEIVKAVFHQMGTPNMKVQYVCTEEEPVQAAARGDCREAVQARFRDSDHQLNLRYTFDTFVVGKSNEFAHAASARSQSSLPRPTTRSSCMVAWVWARPI